jgi:outer membrane receptor protein involved in Fe transport
MGGVLNLLTPEPVYNEPDWQQEGVLYGSYDSVDDGWVVSARTQGGREGLGIAAGASYQDHASRTAGNDRRQVPSFYTSKAADIKLVADLGTRSGLMLSAQVMEQPSTPRYDELVAGYGQDEPSSEQYLFDPNRRSFVHARWRLDGDSGWFDRFEANLARQVITDDRLTQDYGSPEILSEENRSTLDGFTLQFNASTSSGTQWVWGAEYYTDAVDSERWMRLEDTEDESEVRSRFPDGSSMDSAAVYASGDWTNDDRLDISAGMRYSWFDIRLPASTLHEAVSLTPGDLTGDIHLVYEQNPGLKLVANLGRGFRPPNIFDLATLGPRPGNRFNVANTALDPETVWSYDLGLKTESDVLEFEVFGFYMDYTDKITSVYTGEVTEEGRDIVRSENRNSVTLYGLETGLYWSANELLDVFAVINYTRGEEKGDDNGTIPADRIPPLNGKLGLEYYYTDALRVRPFLLFASEQDRLSPRDVRDPRIDPDGTSGWMTVNLHLDWSVTPSLQLGLRLENLTDEFYREHASGIDAPGRNIGLWVRYSLH